MRAKQEDLVREHEKQLAAKLKSDETERFCSNTVHVLSSFIINDLSTH